MTIACYENTLRGLALVFVDSQIALEVAVPRLLTVFDLDPALVNAPEGLS